MSEINVHGDEVYYGEVVPGWGLVRLINKASTSPFIIDNFGLEMEEGDLGLTYGNDPSFIFEVDPIPGEWETTDEKLAIEGLATWAHYEQMLNYCDPVTGYNLVNACIEAGYKIEDNDFAGWLCNRMYQTLQNPEPRIAKRVGNLS